MPCICRSLVAVRSETSGVTLTAGLLIRSAAVLAALAEQPGDLGDRCLRSHPRDRRGHDLTDHGLHADHPPGDVPALVSSWTGWVRAFTATGAWVPNRSRPVRSGPAACRFGRLLSGRCFV